MTNYNRASFKPSVGPSIFLLNFSLNSSTLLLNLSYFNRTTACEVGIILTLILQARKLRARAMAWFPQGLTSQRGRQPRDRGEAKGPCWLSSFPRHSPLDFHEGHSRARRSSPLTVNSGTAHACMSAISHRITLPGLGQKRRWGLSIQAILFLGFR